jgi:magnesium-transporting ATPase (P-type)
MASCVHDLGNGTLRLLNKGASEWVLDIATHVHQEDGSIAVLTPAKKAELLEVVTAMASRGLRTLVCCDSVDILHLWSHLAQRCIRKSLEP